MLNNRKSLLQKARIAMVAIVTIIGFSGAFAMAPHHENASQTYGVIQTVSGGWLVTSSAGDCNGTTSTCKVVSSVPPDENGFISSDDVTQTTPGAFVPSSR